ncbi:bifunctional UDP-N-acetylmuramoyl-tripeptide:D-alanyl-D-alanine ligase/alanine racemase [Limibacter armeniacum]|uniref:bifunctional UDP-N-acetylmuramoyl-tripeptide:D-alanyl-D-alanine ligase/alanine racemase n=1 Tax=Limibacter armeniacum TaxID=466084 RepID=UPI002FE507A4
MDFSNQFWQKRYLLTDSRKLIAAGDTLFFALQGNNHDGHGFIPSLYQLGVRAFVVRKDFNTAEYPDADFFYTSSPLQVLQALVAYRREQFNLTVIGITGSNGKTIIKEWLYSLLEKDRKVVKSPKSYNSQIGVPLSVWEISEAHEVGIFEAGVSQSGEMEHLEVMIKPNIGIFTNIGSAHDKGFVDRTEKVQEKLKLFENAEVLVYCKDHQLIDKEVQKCTCRKFSWGLTSDATLQYKEIGFSKLGKNIELKYQDEVFQLRIPFTDAASVENSMHCIACLLVMGYSFEEIAERIALLRRVGMRLELKQGRHNCKLVDDTYNNDLAGLMVALDFLVQNAGQLTRTVILSDLLETGRDPEWVYSNIAELLKGKGVTKLIAVGTRIMAGLKYFEGIQVMVYPDTESLIQDIGKALSFSNEIILVKGARMFAFERVVSSLQEKVHGTRLEISLESVEHNLNFYRSLLAPDTKLMVMVKAFAYGNSRYELAGLLQYNLVDYLGVAYVDEGIELRENGIKLPIMVLNPSEDTFDKALQYDLELQMYSMQLLKALAEWKQDRGSAHDQIKVQLSFDTGMRRLGFEPADLEKLCNFLIRNAHWLKVTGVFTHLAGADEEVHNSFSKQQLDTFSTMAAHLERQLGYSVIKHAMNSAGIVRFPEAHFDMVRLGIGLYGVDPTAISHHMLQPISTLKTSISQVKYIKEGETVGYSRKGVAERPTTIATIGIGYADGFDRRFSNGVGKVLINGQLAPVIGNVCMDMTMVDITGIEAAEGDEVIVFGEGLTISDQAKAIGTIPYEILTSINERVKRVFYA